MRVRVRVGVRVSVRVRVRDLDPDRSLRHGAQVLRLGRLGLRGWVRVSYLDDGVQAGVRVRVRGRVRVG